MKKRKVLFIDTVHPLLWERLTQAGLECTDASTWSRQDVYDNIGNYNGVVIRSRFMLDESFLSRNPRLEFIARAGAGMENIDQVKATALGIRCINAPEGNRNAVAEHTLAMLLALLNNLVPADHEVKNAKWLREKNRGEELDGKTVGIIGFGNTGSSFAKKLAGFGLNILVYDPYITIETNRYPGLQQVSMDIIFDSCDVLSLHVPLTEETNRLVDSSYLNRFRKPIFLLNTSRGKVVVLSDLAEALVHGKVKGAGLDVLEFETISFENLSLDQLPESFREIATMDNVILSPHVAGWTFESHRKISEVLAEKILALYNEYAPE